MRIRSSPSLRRNWWMNTAMVLLSTVLALMERPGHVITRDHLHDVVYGTASTVESNTIAVFIHQLRRKLGDDLIRTVHGLGYVIGQPSA